jgi:hypothetical protein
MSEMAKMARRVNDHQASIEILERKAIGEVNNWLNEVNQCGVILIQLKDQQKHGDWLPWLYRHCPKLTTRKKDGEIRAEKAQKYMRVAHNWERISKVMHESLLPEQISLRAALALCGESPEEVESNPVRHWPAEERIIGRASKLLGDLFRHPLSKWHPDSVAKLREDLRPLVVELGGTL